MPDNPNKLSQFWQELKRRNVVRVISVYAAVAFVIMELTDMVAPSLGLPGWTMNFIIILLCVGFIIAVILSWIYDIKPEGGLEKTKPVDNVKEEGKQTSSNSWKIASYISFVVIVGLVVFHIVTTSTRSKKISNLEKSIAVLAFSNMSNDPDQEYFSDGISEEILNSLVKVEGIKVVGRTSSFSFKGKDTDIPTIGNKLGVSMVLDGSVRKSEDGVRISAQLINVADGFSIWSEQYDRELKDILSIQEDIATNIVSKLKLTVLRPKGPQQPTDNIEAYNLYLQGRHFWNQGGRDNYDKSIEYYKRALEIDPDYALAYSVMAATYISYATSGYSPRRDVMPQARIAAKKALDIDNTLGEAHAELAWILVFNDWDWHGGEKRFKRALELNPNDARSHSGYAWLLSFVGRHDEAIQESKRAHELDPLSERLWKRLGFTYYCAREYDKAIEEYRNVLEVFSDSRLAHIRIAEALLAKGLLNEAIEECSKIDVENLSVGYIYGIAGKKEKAREILNYYLEESEKRFIWPSSIAFIYIGLGEKDKAFEWLEETYDQHEAFMDLLLVYPKYDSLRSDPRFQDLVDRMNFP
jgi:TolB-like protein